MKLIITEYKQRIGLFGLEENSLVKANIYDVKQEICIGEIYLGRVNKVLSNLGACFVQIGGKEEVFLPFDEMKQPLKSGDSVLLQIKKEASKGKNALGTTKLTISGMYCVVNYEVHSIEVSSKLSSEQRNYWKKVLKDVLSSQDILPEDKEILLKYCVIVRTNVSESVALSEVISEWITLAKKMDYILEKGKYQSLFSKLYSEDKPYIKHIENLYQGDIEEVLTDDTDIYNELRNAFNNSPEMIDKIRLYQDVFPVSKLYSLDAKMEDALNKKVWLKCGGFLVIEPTEALTVIDVNSGKYEKKSDSEEYYKKVNEEAVIEIARQLKLRNISGIIIIDFINMKSERNKCELLDKLSQLVSKDRIKTHVMGMTSLGLVEMTRAKIEKPLWEQIQLKCK